MVKPGDMGVQTIPPGFSDLHKRMALSVTHEVTIAKRAVIGMHHRSLTQIAREITGTRWSSPRFLGLNGKQP